MRQTLVLILLAAVALTGVAAERYDLMKFPVTDQSRVAALEQAGCIVNGPDLDGRILVEVPVAKLAALEQGGFTPELVKADIYEFYRQNGLDGRFHSYTEMKDTFRIMAQNNSGFVKFETLGLASNDSLLFALKITDNPQVEEDEPEMLFEGAIHGDEKCATEVVFAWAVYLIQNYGVDPLVTQWVNQYEIWVQCPNNPYGHINGVRTNRNGYDCNRDYGFMWYYETSAREPFTQRETQAHARLAMRNPFNFWSSGHGGTLFCSTPWSYSPYGTPDSIGQQYLALQYHNLTGYDWGPGYRGMYKINGSSKDYDYGSLGGISWTIENCLYKTPPVESLDQLILRERTAYSMVMNNINRGVRGIITDSLTGRPIRARIRPLPIDFPAFCDSLGDYHRYLRAGTYNVQVDANGYRTKTISGVVVTNDTVTRVDVQLAPDSLSPVALHRFIAGRGVSTEAITSTPDYALGVRDGRRFSMGLGGMAIYDIGQTIYNQTGDDFMVYEDDADPEGYRVDVAGDFLGPWTTLRRDTGTAAFDIAGVGACRFIRITDDSSSTSGATAGFDLDAIEATVASVAAVVLDHQTVLDTLPGGNRDGKLDPDETADLVLTLKNVGRLPAQNISAELSTADAYVSVLDANAIYGTLMPDSSRANYGDAFQVYAAAGTPREHAARMKLRLTGTGYLDSLEFDIVVGAVQTSDPIPDGPRTPALYWAYDNTDAAYPQCPTYNWVEINGAGTRLTLSDDQTTTLTLPPAFGPWRYYGTNFTQLAVCGNGWIAAGASTRTSYQNTSLPNAAEPPMVVLNWDDLYPPTGNGVWYYHDAANHRFIVEYDSVSYYPSGSAYDKFEFVLYDTTVVTPSRDNLILTQYRTASGFGSSTIGLQDPTRTIAIEYLGPNGYHRAAAPIAAGRAILYTTSYGTGIADNARPTTASRFSVEPNLVRGMTRVRFGVAQAGPVSLSVCDLSGRKVDEVVRTTLEPGNYELNWRPRPGLVSGVYFLRLETTGGSETRKLVVQP